MLLDALPAHIHDVAVVLPLHGLEHPSARHAQTSIHMAYDVRPQRPSPGVPGFVGGEVDCCAGEGGALAEGLVLGREFLYIGVAGEGSA